MNRKPGPLVWLCPLLLLATSARTQVTSTTIYGSILDPSGAAVADAKVTVTNEQTGSSATANTDSSGEFTFTFLPAGVYTALIEAKGFRSQRQTGLDLSAGQRIGVNYTLQLGSVTETVEVVAVTPLVNTVSAEQREDKTELQVRELPLARRDWTGVLSIGTGISRGGIDNNGVSMNGLPASAFRLTVDGTDAEGDPEIPSLGMYQNFNVIKTVSLEAISEVDVSKGIPSAEVANTMSGNVNIITKRGTNQFHGSLFLNNQVEDLAARNQFAATKGPVVFNQFGGSFGGPIIRNKLFAFGVYEGYRQRAFRTISGNVPTAQFRERAIAAVPAYKSYFDLYPLPAGPTPPDAITAFYVTNGSNAAQDNHAVTRVDYQITSNLLLGGRYTRGRPSEIQPRINIGNERSFNGLSEAGTANLIYSRPTWSSESRVGYNFNDVLRVDGIYALGIPGIVGNLGFGVAGETLFKGGNTTTFEEVIAKTIGRHNLKAGGLFFRRVGERDNIETPEMAYTDVADFLANIPSRIQVTWGVNPFQIRQWQTGFFVHDDFRLSRRLTLNFGIRYDYFSVPKERDSRLFNLSDYGRGPLRPADSIYDADYNNFSPRVSFAWTVDESAKTVIRGGFGTFVNPRNLYAGPVEVVQNAVDEPSRRVFSRADALANSVLRYPVVNTNVLPLVKGQTIAPATVVNTDFPNPYSLQWTLGIQRQLTDSMVLETAYVGTRGIKLIMVRDLNQVDRVTGVRPDSRFGAYRAYDSSERTRYESWQSSLRKRFSNDFLFNVHYTWSSLLSFNEADLVLPSARPQDPENLRAERGPAPLDIRHRFTSDFIYELPFGKLLGSDNTAGNFLLRGWQFGGIFSAQSGFPFHIGQPSSVTGQRVDYRGGSAYLDNPAATLQFLNGAAFGEVPIVQASGASIRPGTLGRNALRGPGFWNVDLALSKNISFTESLRLQIRADLFNAFNHTAFSGIETNIRSGNFGRFTSTRGARIIQLNARLSF